MRKIIICYFLIVFGLVGCSPVEDTGIINIGAMNGPTIIGLAHLQNDNYNLTKESTADAITAGLINKKYDVAAIPCNVASILANNAALDIEVAVINTLSTLYLVENGNTINSLEDLRGKTIYSPGQGTTPEFVLRHLLARANITDVEIIFRLEATEIVAGLKNNTMSIALLPQPAATAATIGSNTINVRLDIGEIWNQMEESSIVTGVLVVRRAFLEKHQEAFLAFLEDYQQSVNFMTNPDNQDVASDLIVELGVVPSKTIALVALPLCNITYLDGDEMKQQIIRFLTILYNQNPQAIGGNLPNEDFYFQK